MLEIQENPAEKLQFNEIKTRDWNIRKNQFHGLEYLSKKIFSILTHVNNAWHGKAPSRLFEKTVALATIIN